jgi:hypothetical protein
MLGSVRRATTETAERAFLGAVRWTLGTRMVDMLAEEVVRYRVVERVMDPLIQAGELEHLVATVLDTPAARRLSAQLLESEELWVVIDEIARSPSVTQAISHQGVGLADEVAGAVRTRSRSADDRLERIAHRVLRRGTA